METAVDKEAGVAQQEAMEKHMFGHEKFVQMLLEKDGVDVDSKDKRGRTPFSNAAEGGHGGVLYMLLERGRVDVAAKTILQGRERSNPTINGGTKGHEQVVHMLLEKDGVDVDSKDEKGCTTLYSVENFWDRNEKVRQMLIAKGAH
ncbi:hypothetical protein Q9L58_010357 [Maublancomyces gigas]|uniref:Ankyrin n=1 Tax=Discina gigas TaxID=1032678 RepID=A0ABR3G4S8_9PEZI